MNEKREEEVERGGSRERDKRKVWDNQMRAIQRKTKREEGRYKGTQPEVKLSRCHSSMSLVTSYTFNLLETTYSQGLTQHWINNTWESVLYPTTLPLLAFCPSPGHHLLFLVGGMASAADWVDGCGQEVQPVVFKVLIHQRQDDLRVKWHRYSV